MWYAFTMDGFVDSANTKKELLKKLSLGALPYKVKGRRKGIYTVFEQDENDKTFSISTYYIYDCLLKANRDGFYQCVTDRFGEIIKEK